MEPIKEPQLTAIGLSDVIFAPINPSRLATFKQFVAITKLCPAFKTTFDGVFPAAALLNKTVPVLISLNEIVVLFSVAKIDAKV